MQIYEETVYWKEKSKQYSHKLKQRRNEVEGCTKTIEDYLIEIKELKQENLAIKQEMSIGISIKEDEIERAKELNQRLREKLEKVGQENSILRKDMTIDQTQIAQLSNEIQKHKEVIAQLTTSNDNLRSMIK